MLIRVILIYLANKMLTAGFDGDERPRVVLTRVGGRPRHQVCHGGTSVQALCYKTMSIANWELMNVCRLCAGRLEVY